MKLYNHNRAFDVAADWGLDPNADYDIKIACVPLQCNDPTNFSYHGDIDFSQFDLVLISDIEMQTVNTVETWAKNNGIKNYLVTVGGLHDHETLPSNYVYRPWWCYNFMSLNQYQDTSGNKPYLFDVLLGARRPHRDYIMLAFQHSDLLESSIVNYREFFQGAIVNQDSQQVADQFTNALLFPYNSPNVRPEWEVLPELHRGISSIGPWEIYRRTKYTVVCETLGTGGCFFMSEKTTKAIFAERVFIPVAARNYIKNLKALGFEVFENVIDISYDSEHNDIDRYRGAFEQIQRLASMDHQEVLAKTQEQRIHNRTNLQRLRDSTRQQQTTLIKNAVESALTTSH